MKEPQTGTKEPQTGKITDKVARWRDFFKGSFMSAYDIQGDVTLKIKEMRYDEVTLQQGRKDKCLIAVFEGDTHLPMIINTTNAKAISDLHGSIYPVDWEGKRITLFVDKNVRMKGETVGGIRIRPQNPALPKLGEPRFSAMVAKIKSNEYTLEKAMSSFTLTAAQIKQIQDATK